MCNIAGYVGTKHAAPILLEMMKREEGFAGGYNTGIATIHKGKLYYTKLVGGVQKLIDETVKKGYDIIISELKSGAKTFNELLKPLASLFENCECMTRAALVYSVLYALKKEDRINIDTVLAEPIFEGIDVPKFVISLKK